MTRPEFKAHLENDILGADMGKMELERVLRRLFADYGQRFDKDFQVQDKGVLLVRNPETGQMNRRLWATPRCGPVSRATSLINWTRARPRQGVCPTAAAPKAG